MAFRGTDGHYHFICKICGKPSIGTSGRSEVCNDCKTSGRYQTYKYNQKTGRNVPYELGQRTCEACGKIFTPNRNYSKYCPNCRKKHMTNEQLRIKSLRTLYLEYCKSSGATPIVARDFYALGLELLDRLPHGSTKAQVFETVKALTYKPERKIFDSIEEVDRRAACEGLSYGVYVARHYYK